MVVNGLLRLMMVMLLFASFHLGTMAQTFEPMRFYKSPAKVTYGLNNRRTSLLGNSVTIFGGYIGVQWGERLKHVVTANSSIFWMRPNANTLPPRSYHLNYIGLAEEYAFVQWNRWQLVSFLHAGWGSFHERKFEANAFDYTLDWVLPLELGGHFSYGLTNWLDLIAGAGYRWVLLDESHTLDGLYYKASLSVDLKTLRNSCSTKKNNLETSFNGLH
jgi:hypothetical protein